MSSENLSQPQHIEVRKIRDGQLRPYIAGTRVRVQDILFYHDRLGQDAEEIVRSLPHLTLAQVHGALAYYFENRQAAWDCIREDEAYVQPFKKQLTGTRVVLVGFSSDVTDAAVPS